jgi:hypothetical protein
VFEALGEETACSAAGIVDGLVRLGVDDLDHRLDDLAWYRMPFFSMNQRNSAAAMSLFPSTKL